MVMYLLGALFFVQMVQSADQNAFAVVPNNQQFAIQPQIPVPGIPVQSDAFGALYQTLPYYQFINGAHCFAGMVVVPVGLNPWQAYSAYPQANYYPQASALSFGQSDCNQGVISSNLADQALVPSAVSSELPVAGPDAHEIHNRDEEALEKAKSALKIYEEKLLLSSEKDRANWERLTKRKRDEVQRIESDMQKERLGALFEVAGEEIVSFAMPQPKPKPSFNPVPNSTKPSSALSPEDVGKRIKELRDQFSRTRNTLNTYRRKSNSESFSSIRRAQFKVCAEKKQVELEKMEKEMKSLEVAVTPPKKKCKKSSKHE